MFFSIFQAPRSRLHTITNLWCESYHNLSRQSGSNSTFKLITSDTVTLGGYHSRRWIGRPFSTDDEDEKNNTTKGDQASQRHEFLNGISELKKVQCYDSKQEIAEIKDIDDFVTIIVFDFETTGLYREKDRITEICLHDLAGGEGCTFHKLVNPGHDVPNSSFHGIKSSKVNRPDVSRMEAILPNLLQFVERRQKPGGCILWVAHNARCFDVLFLINAFKRCSIEIPSKWLFLDTLPLARELLKLEGSKVPFNFSLQELRKFYGIPLVGSAHTANSDVNSLSEIFKRLTTDLNLETADLLERSFTASDVIKVKKARNSS